MMEVSDRELGVGNRERNAVQQISDLTGIQSDAGGAPPDGLAPLPGDGQVAVGAGGRRRNHQRRIDAETVGRHQGRRRWLGRGDFSIFTQTTLDSRIKTVLTVSPQYYPSLSYTFIVHFLKIELTVYIASVELSRAAAN